VEFDGTPFPKRGDEKPQGVWVRHQIGRWLVRARIVGQGGRPVIAELTIAPVNKTVVPSGGITTNRLIRQIPFGTFGPYALGAVQKMVRGIRPDNNLARLFLHLTGLQFPVATAPRPRPRRARGQPDFYFARLSRDYVRLVERSSKRPVLDLAEAREMDAKKVRDQLN
jgi:hypothetical protein